MFFEAPSDHAFLELCGLVGMKHQYEVRKFQQALNEWVRKFNQKRTYENILKYVLKMAKLDQYFEKLQEVCFIYYQKLVKTNGLYYNCKEIMI